MRTRGDGVKRHQAATKNGDSSETHISNSIDISGHRHQRRRRLCPHTTVVVDSTRASFGVDVRRLAHGVVALSRCKHRPNSLNQVVEAYRAVDKKERPSLGPGGWWKSFLHPFGLFRVREERSTPIGRAVCWGRLGPWV